MKISLPKDLYDFLSEKLMDKGYEVIQHDDPLAHLVDVYVGFGDKNLHRQNYPNLKMVQLNSSGFDQLDLEKLKQDAIKVQNAKGVYSEAIAEYVFAYLFYILKDIETLAQNQREKAWERHNFKTMSLKNKTIFLLGTGSINTEIAKRMKAFKTKQVGFNSDGRSQEHFDETAPLSQLSQMIQDADVVICALPDNAATRHLFNQTLFQKMKQDAIFINVGRGSLVDETAIKDNTKHLRMLVMDVFEEEPLSTESDLWHLEQMLLTPHISNRSDENIENLAALVLMNLKKLENHEELVNTVV